MAYTYIDIVNEILVSLGEVPFDNEVDFNGAVGFPLYIKNAVNTVIEDICNDQDNRWPFQQEEGTQVLTSGIQEYSLDTDVVHVDWYSFYITYDAALEDKYARELTYLPWQQYKRRYREIDKNTDSVTEYSKPRIVSRVDLTSTNKFLVSPIPDDAYTVKWTQFVFPVELATQSDVPIIPRNFKSVLIEGVRRYGFKFREDLESEQSARQDYERKLDSMRRVLIQQPDTLVTDQ